MIIEPYLYLNGQTEESLFFYEPSVPAWRRRYASRYLLDPDPEGQLPPGFEQKVMHASLLIGDKRVMLSDGGCFSLSLQYPTEGKPLMRSLRVDD